MTRPPSGSGWLKSAAVRAWLATLAVTCVAVALVAAVAFRDHPQPNLLLVGLFFALCLTAERIFFEFETGRRDHTYIANEIPLLLALFYLPPLWAVGARVAAAAVAYLFRFPPVQVLFNVANRAAGVAAGALLVLNFAPLAADKPQTWLVLIGATEINGLISLCGVTLVLTALQGWAGWRKFIDSAVTGLIMGTLNAV